MQRGHRFPVRGELIFKRRADQFDDVEAFGPNTSLERWVCKPSDSDANLKQFFR